MQPGPWARPLPDPPPQRPLPACRRRLRRPPTRAPVGPAHPVLSAGPVAASPPRRVRRGRPPPPPRVSQLPPAGPVSPGCFPTSAPRDPGAPGPSAPVGPAGVVTARPSAAPPPLPHRNPSRPGNPPKPQKTGLLMRKSSVHCLTSVFFTTCLPVPPANNLPSK